MRLHRLAELVSKSCGHAAASSTLQTDQISGRLSDRSVKLCHIVGLAVLNVMEPLTIPHTTPIFAAAATFRRNS